MPTNPIVNFEQGKWPVQPNDELTHYLFEDLRKRIFLSMYPYAGAEDYIVDYNQPDGTVVLQFSSVSQNYPYDNTHNPSSDIYARQGDWYIVHQGELWVNRVDFTYQMAKGGSGAYDPPVLHPEDSTWNLQNTYWALAADANQYHHFDFNSGRKVIACDVNGSGVTARYCRIEIDAWRMLPVQMDPFERERPYFYASTQKPGWQYKPVELNKLDITQLPTLGPVAGVLNSSGYWGDIRVFENTQQSGWVMYDIDPNFGEPLDRAAGPEVGDQYHRRNGYPGVEPGGNPDAKPNYTYKSAGDQKQWWYDPKFCDAYQNCIERAASQDKWIWEASSEYKTNWSNYYEQPWSVGNYDATWWCNPFPKLNERFWGANESAFEAVLGLLGDEYFDWYYDTEYLYVPQFIQKARFIELQGSYTLEQVNERYPLPVGTWRRVWKQTLGRKHKHRLRCGKNGKPTGQNWNSTIMADGKWPGLFVSSHPDLDAFFEFSWTISPQEDGSCIEVSSDVTDQLKVAGCLSITENSGNIVEDVLDDCSILSFEYDDGNDKTIIHIDKDVSSYAGKKIRGDKRLMDSHDPVQIDYEHDRPEYELTANLMNSMREVLKKLVISSSSGFTLQKWSLWVSVGSTSDYGGASAYYWPDGRNPYGSNFQSQTDAVKWAQGGVSDFLNKYGHDPDDDDCEYYNGWATGGNYGVSWVIHAQNNQRSHAGWDHAADGPKGGHSNVGGYMMVDPSDFSYAELPPYCYSGWLEGYMVALKMTMPEGRSIGKGVASQYAVIVTASSIGGLRQKSYWNESGGYWAEDSNVNVEGCHVNFGQFSLGMSPKLNSAVYSTHTMPCNGVEYNGYRKIYNSDTKKFYFPVTPSPKNAATWNIGTAGEFPSVPTIGNSTWLHDPCYYNYFKRDWAVGKKGLNVSFQTTSLVYIEHDRTPDSVWQRDHINHIDFTTPPAPDFRPPVPNPPAFYTLPYAYFKYVEEDGGVPEHFELWIAMETAKASDLEESDPVKYRAVGLGDAPNSPWQQSRLIEIKVRDISMAEAIQETQLPCQNGSTSNPSGEIMRIPVVSTLMAGDTVRIGIAGFSGIYTVVHSTSGYIDIDLAEKGGDYVQDIETSSSDKVTELHGYDEPEWELESCRNWHFALQSKDSAIAENTGSYSHFEKVQMPEKWPWEIYDFSK